MHGWYQKCCAENIIQMDPYRWREGMEIKSSLLKRNWEWLAGKIETILWHLSTAICESSIERLWELTKDYQPCDI